MLFASLAQPDPHPSLTSFTRTTALRIFLWRKDCCASTKETWDILTCVCHPIHSVHPCPGRGASSGRSAILTAPTCGSKYSPLKRPHMPSPFPLKKEASAQSVTMLLPATEPSTGPLFWFLRCPVTLQVLNQLPKLPSPSPFAISAKN